MKKRRYQKRYTKGEIIRNRILVVLLVLALALAAACGLSMLGKEEEGSQGQSSSSESFAEESSEEQQESSAAQPESSAPEESSSLPESSQESASSESQVSSQSTVASGEDVSEEDPFYEPEMPILVNPTNRIPEDYVPDVADMGNGYQFDRKATQAYNEMLRAANADGISLWVVSAYRDNDKQTTNFNNKVKEYEAMGYSAQEAYDATAKIIAVPGTSEHSLGLALDLNSLEQSFENTETYRWLVSHCAEYGFILRYPKDKEEITQIIFEPWHYRYVGTNHAKIIMEKGICLEEYLSGDY